MPGDHAADRRDDMQPPTQSVHAAVVARDIIDDKRAHERFRRRENARVR
jgi:hypothetical protein